MAITSFTFDEQYYLQQNPDVAAAVSKGSFASGQAHFNAFGRFEQRDPNAFFDTSFYLGQYPDVAASGLNPFQHFLQFGARENRAFNANELAAIDTDNNGQLNEFNVQAYLDAPGNADVKAAVNAGLLPSAYQHFVLFGQFEGRTATLNNGTVITGPIALAGNGTGGANVGTTFTLTTNVDAPGAQAPAVNTQGTTGNDTFNAVNGSVNTLTAADQINGGTGVDTLNLLLDTNTSAVSLTGVSNVEIFNLRDIEAANPTVVDFATVAGETQVWNDRSSGAVTFNNVGTGATVGVRGDNTSNISATTFTMATATDAVSIAIDGGVKGGAAITRNQTGEAAVTITSTGAANTVGVIDLDTGAAIKAVTINATAGLTANLAAGDFATGSTLTVTGAGAVNLSGAALSDNLTTINAAGSTGGVNVAAGAGAVTFTGGAGADRVAFGANYASTDTVNGGAGRDTVALNGADFTTANNDALKGLNALTNVEVLEFTGATGVTISGGTAATAFTNSTVDQLIFNTNGNDTVELAGARLYSFGSTNAGDATFNSALGQTTLNLSLIGATTAAGAAATVGTLTASGASTINIASTGSTTAVNNIGSLAVAANSAVTLTGAQALTIGGVTNSSSINGSAATGVLNITGSAAVDALTGGAGNDTLFGRAGADTIVGGAGNDVIQGDGVGVAAILAANETFKATFGSSIDADTVSFDGVSKALTGGQSGIQNAATYTTAYNADGARTFNAVANGDGTVTFTSIASGARNDVVTNDFVVTSGGAGADTTVTAAAPTVQGVTAAAATIGNGNDAAAADILTGGLGNDNFRFASGTSVVTAFDTITDLNLGSADASGRVDILTFQNAGATAPTLVTLNAGQQTAVTGTANFAAAVDAVAAIATADGATAQFTYGSDTYIFHAGDANGATFQAGVDAVVKITGVTGTLDVSDIATI